MDELIRGLAQALRDEFPFVMGLGIQATDESWEKAAGGILTKMNAKVGSHRTLVTGKVQYELRLSVDPATESALDP